MKSLFSRAAQRRRNRRQEGLTASLVAMQIVDGSDGSDTGSEAREKATAFLLDSDLQAFAVPSPRRTVAQGRVSMARGSVVTQTDSAVRDPTPSSSELDEIAWSSLQAVEAPSLAEDASAAGASITINSGGAVFFLHFAPPLGRVVLKVCATTGATQSEVFATSLCGALGIHAPRQRLVRRAANAKEWLQACDALSAIGEDEFAAEAKAQLQHTSVQAFILMSAVPGSPLVLQRAQAAVTDDFLPATARAIGRILVLDLLLANEDRLRYERLHWRGNTGNLLWSEESGLYAIDTGLARRPPADAARVAAAAYPHLLKQVADGVAPLLPELLSASAAAEAELAASFSGTAAAAAALALASGVADALIALQPLTDWLRSLARELDAVFADFFSAAERTEAISAYILQNIQSPKGGGPPRRFGNARGTTKAAASALVAGGSKMARMSRNGTFLLRKLATRPKPQAPVLQVEVEVSSPDAGSMADKLPESPAHVRRQWLLERGALARARLDDWRAAHRAPAGVVTGFIEEDVSAQGFLASAYELHVRLKHLLERAEIVEQASLPSSADPLDAERI